MWTSEASRHPPAGCCLVVKINALQLFSNHEDKEVCEIAANAMKLLTKRSLEFLVVLPPAVYPLLFLTRGTDTLRAAI